jgi:LysM repeat protein
LSRLGRTAWLYKRMKRNSILILVPLAITFLLALFGSLGHSQAQAGDPYSLIDAVNSLRANNGLPPYQVNSILMGISQAHSDYQAAIGQVTHIGSGGTRPRDRAAAAGYGGGGTFFISENIAGGTDLSVDGAISMWLGDDPHIQTMLGANYQDIGAGVSVADGIVYYTIDAAYVAGGANYSPPATSKPGGPTAIPYYAVQTTTPNSDGSIVHTVRSGQNLTLIAKAYGITVAEIKQLNHLTSDTIYEGDILIIRLSNTPGPTDTPSATITPTPVASPTRNPTRTPTPSASPAVTSSVTLIADSVLADGAQSGSDRLGNILVIAIIVMAIGGVILIVAGSVLKRGNRG